MFSVLKAADNRGELSTKCIFDLKLSGVNPSKLYLFEGNNLQSDIFLN